MNSEAMAAEDQRPGRPPSSNWLSHLSGPVKVGLFFALLAIIMSVVGLVRDPTTPVTARSILIATLISGGTWGVVSWAIATAVVDVEQDVAEREDDPLEDDQ